MRYSKNKPTTYGLINSLEKTSVLKVVIILSLIFSVSAIIYSYLTHTIISYGDAESHLNISKRVISSLTPGLSQLGGVWLPLPHLLMIPFVIFDPLWRLGLAGSIVSGIAYIISGVFLYKTTLFITKSIPASFFSFLVFALNPNILYLQSTPMTELILICFSIISIYFFAKFLDHPEDTLSLVASALFGFLATLTRYDGWFLVLFEFLIILLVYLNKIISTQSILKKKTKFYLKSLEGKVVLFSTLAFLGISLWLFWGLIILGDPLYFSHSEFSANAQQKTWLIRNELPSFDNLPMAIAYYSVTVFANLGSLMSLLAIIGLISFLVFSRKKERIFLAIILITPFFFNVFTLFIGQSVIFIPYLTPATFEWRLFNVRYGMLMIPALAFFIGFLISLFKKNIVIQGLFMAILIIQLYLFFLGFEPVISRQDGISGLSTQKKPDAQIWLTEHYDKGLVLVDDYARTVSIINTGIPMQNIIYIGNKPFWGISLKEPEHFATWIIMQKDDTVWKNIYDDPNTQGRLYKYFNKVYTSPDILIFKRA